MIRNRCRALIRDSDSDLPRNSPPLTFLSLSREIRDEIYDLALVSTSPIIVWKGEGKMSYRYQAESEGVGPRAWPWAGVRPPPSIVPWQEVDREAISASLQPLAVNLIFCNKTVSHEAARVFYAKNTFSFLGKHNWDPIVSWLEIIGPANRNSLISIEISARKPDPAWQCPSGERIRDPCGYTYGEVYQRHPYLQLCTTEEHSPCGQVANVNPAVETIFILLGGSTSKRKVTIVMQLDGCVYPGARVPRDPNDCMPETRWNSMDLPNIIEKSRSLHTPRVEVLWKGKDCRKELEDQQSIMESIGWDVNVLPAMEDELHPNPEYHCCHPATHEWRIAKYVLRRKELTGLLLQDPCRLPHWMSAESMQNVI